MLTLFTTCRQFTGHRGIIQRNAIESWVQSCHRCEVMMFGNEVGYAEVAKQFNLRQIPNVSRSENGKILLNDMMEKAQQLARFNILCYVNADIILGGNLARVIDLISRLQKDFLIIGQRVDLDIEERIDFKNPLWSRKLKTQLHEHGRPHPFLGVDYFIFKKGFYKNIPPFAVGNCATDEWLIYNACIRNAMVIDATSQIQAIHQNHLYGQAQDQYGHRDENGEKRNAELAGEVARSFCILDATHILTRKGLRPNLSIQRLRRLFARRHSFPSPPFLLYVILPLFFARYAIRKIREILNRKISTRIWA